MTYNEFHDFFFRVLEEDRETLVNDLMKDITRPSRERAEFFVDQLKKYQEEPNVANLRALTGLSQSKFSERYDIPKRTIENWEKESDFVVINAKGLYKRWVLMYVIFEELLEKGQIA